MVVSHGVGVQISTIPPELGRVQQVQTKFPSRVGEWSLDLESRRTMYVGEGIPVSSGLVAGLHKPLLESSSLSTGTDYYSPLACLVIAG